MFTVISKGSPSSDETEQLVNDLRDNVVPQAVKGTDLTVYVGGQTAGYIDLADRISSKLPLMIVVVVGLSCLVLFVAFRSILVPLKAAFANLISVAAAYGVLTFIFQEGHGARPDRPRGGDADRFLRAAVHVRDPVRPVDGLRGVPAQPDPGPLQAGASPPRR